MPAGMQHTMPTMPRTRTRVARCGRRAVPSVIGCSPLMLTMRARSGMGRAEDLTAAYAHGGGRFNGAMSLREVTCPFLARPTRKAEAARGRAAKRPNGLPGTRSGAILACGTECFHHVARLAPCCCHTRVELRARVVELRFFGGLSMDEIAGLLNLSKRSVEADWTLARTWLHHELA